MMTIRTFFNFSSNVETDLPGSIHFSAVETLRNGRRIYQALQPELFLPKLLLQPALFGVDCAETVENPVVGVPQIDGED
ncbi:MAG: hypothetical protein ACYSUC_08650 [Planctomycetota bacterium]